MLLYELVEGINAMRGSQILEGLADERQAIDKNKNVYMNYIKNHKENVIKAYNEYMIPLMNRTPNQELKEAILKAGKNVQYHDLSKYEPVEFEAYRRHFYPTDFEKADPNFVSATKVLYDVAWKHHHENNEHHPEHWGLDKNPPEDMPLEFIIEMFCDWIAMDMYYKGSPREWWESEKTQKDEATYMTPKTREWVETILYDLLPDISFKEE